MLDFNLLRFSSSLSPRLWIHPDQILTYLSEFLYFHVLYAVRWELLHQLMKTSSSVWRDWNSSAGARPKRPKVSLHIWEVKHVWNQTDDISPEEAWSFHPWSVPDVYKLGQIVCSTPLQSQFLSAPSCFIINNWESSWCFKIYIYIYWNLNH